MKRKPKRESSIILKVLCLGVCVYVFANLVNLWSTLNDSQAELKALKEEYAATENDIAELKAMLADESNAQIIEKAARERLGYIFSDEQVFIDVSGN
ncbi:MAG: septum formation initiator family protein [Clostridia bacterium]|nr:septum formation initiator family protein [Clostridia bacterium]